MSKVEWFSLQKEFMCIGKPAKYSPSTIQNVYASYEEFEAIIRKYYLIIFKSSAGIWMLIDEINVVERLKIV